MTEPPFSPEDHASLIRWIKSRGGSDEQAGFAARQLMKRARKDAENERITPLEAMGRILEKVARAERVFEEAAGSASPESGAEPPKSP